jgi:hypothetical protein
MSDKPKSLRKAVLKISGRDEAFDNIKAYYESDDEIVLPPHQEDIRLRWNAVYRLILSGEMHFRIQEKISELYSVSESTVRRDIESVSKLFSTSSMPHEMRRQRALNMALETRAMAKSEGDYANMNRAEANIAKIEGLENAGSGGQQVEPHVYVVILDPHIKALFEKFYPMKDSRINLNDAIQDVQDAEYEEV